MSKRSRSAHRGESGERSSALPAPEVMDRRVPRATWAAIIIAIVALAAAALAVYHGQTHGLGAGRVDATTSTEIEELIRRYFRTWSDHDMQGYGACFLPGAAVQFVDAQGNIDTQDLASFLKGQSDLLARDKSEKEVPESIDIRGEGRLARVVVYWKLTHGTSEVFGYDHFTLLKSDTDGKWSIVNLAFYETRRQE